MSADVATTQSPVRKAQSHVRTAIVTPQTLPEATPLETALQAIQADSLQDPETYLAETIVPAGGE